jgi:hypothetical protein
VTRLLPGSRALPLWAGVPLDLGGASLLLALFGLVWDVAYHVDHGRDVTLLNPPHLLILVGLAGIGVAAASSIALATAARVSTGWRLGPLRIPWAATPLAVMAGGALAGFPLDDLWHRTYGIDVTLWSPTHLTMIGGAALSTFALGLFPLEARAPSAPETGLRWRRVLQAGGMLLALSVFQLEFDFGVPQWQALYQPLLIAIMAGVGLTAARAAIGTWGAVQAALCFLAIRALISVVVGPVLGHTTPRFPLVLGSALAVEAAFWLGRRRPAAVTGMLAGLLVGTFGRATEWAWSQLWGREPWQLAMLPRMWAPVAAAVLAAVVGAAMGGALARRPAGIPVPVVVVSLLALAGLLAVPMPRDSAPISGHLVATRVGPERPTTDRFGAPSVERDVTVELTITPRDAAAGADWFEVVAWQGGGQRGVPLVADAPGRYRTETPVPTGGSWKAMVFLARGDVMTALPIAFPADIEYANPGIPLVPVRDGAFVPSQTLLTTEAHAGPPAVADAAYVALLGAWALWIGLLLVSFHAVGRPPGPDVQVASAEQLNATRRRLPASRTETG